MNAAKRRARTHTSAILAAVLAAFVLTLGPASAATFHHRADDVLGTSFHIAVTADDQATADAAVAAAQDEIARLERIFSTYDPESEISQLNAATDTPASAELIGALSLCEEWRVRTGGALSCRIGAVIDAWDEAEEADAPPARMALRLLSGEIRRATLELNADDGRILREDPVRLATDAIAKGIIIDAALGAARAAAPAATGLLVDIGGDLKVWGEGPEGGAWRVGVAAPERAADNAPVELVLTLADGAVASSGVGARDRTIAGERYGHVISPLNGWVVGHVAAATVRAPDAATADALATALMVKPIAEGLAFAESLEGVEALIAAADGRRYWTSGWASLAGTADAAAEGVSSAWPNGFELAVDYEIPAFDLADYERPYVAIWVADADRNLIRILTLEGEETRWMEENYVWYRRFGRYAGSLVDAVARPTRRPGAYSLVWDGLRDDGAAAGPGDYILHIEATREHGGRQYETLELAIGDAPFQLEVAPGEELGAVSVRYGAP